MTDVEGKISIWIRSGSFSHASDLYIQVLVDDDKIWRTDDKNGFSPEWDSTVTKHLKGNFEQVELRLMDEDTYGGRKLALVFMWRDDIIATVAFPIADLLDDGINGEFEMNDTDGNPVGTVSVNMNFESGDVGFFDMFGSMLHKSDD